MEYSQPMVVKDNSAAKERFLADLELLAKAGLSNADIGRGLEIHRNAIKYWRDLKGQRGPSRLSVDAMRAKLDSLLQEHELTPSS